MGPKRVETKQTMEIEAAETGQVTIADSNTSRMATLEQIMISLQQQMKNQQITLDRLAQRFCDEDDRKRRADELGKSKVTTEEESQASESIPVASVPSSAGVSLVGTSTTPAKLPHNDEQSRPPASSDDDPSEEIRMKRKHPLKRLELPLFDGEDAESWVLRVDQYFEIGAFTEEERLKDIRMCFIGEALPWYRWERDRNPFRSWTEMKERVLEQFSTNQDTTAGERLMALRQEGSVRDYIRDFKALASNAPEFTEATLELAFMHGLKAKIRAGVKMLEPRTLEKMMHAAKRVEDWETHGESALAAIPESRVPSSKPQQRSSAGSVGSFQRSGSGPTQQSNKPNNTTPGPGQNAKALGPTNRSTTHFRLKPPFRRLTPTEMAKWRAEGLCYKCDEKHFAGHVCSRSELTVLITMEDGTEVECMEAQVDFTEEENEIEAGVAEVSVNSVVGLSSPKTMKLRGRIGAEEVVILIDSGASHNFISEKLVEKLGLVTATTSLSGVLVAGGVSVKGKGVIHNVELEMQDCTIVTSFLPLELGIADVILGVQWLDTLGEMRVNWRSQQMKIKLGEKELTLQGDKSLHSAEVSFKALQKGWEKDGEGMVIEFAGLIAPELGAVQTFSEKWAAVIEQFAEVFQEPTGLPPSRGREHAITLENGAQPVSVRPFRYPQVQKAEIERQVAAMLAAGIIQESCSPFSSPVLLVRKKDGSWRFCIDYRALNRVTIADRFPIPMIDQLLDELHGAKIFSKLDLRSGYHQIRVRTEDVPKTAFRTHDGHYEFLVMPFGLSNAPATFQSLMNEVFRPLLRKSVLVFFDDILVYSQNESLHQQHLTEVLNLLQRHQLYANRKKCQFGCEQIEYLGHVISAEGVAADTEKIKAMVEWKQPRNVKALRGFLGLTGYYRKFVMGYGHIARPLTSQLKKEQFLWNDEATKAFENLKRAMTTIPVLAMPDFTALFEVESDASAVGLGAVLMQRGRPLAFFSQALTERQKLKSVYERELMAIVFAIQKWRHYLVGRKFVVRTDQKSLKFLLEQREINMEYQRWLTKLLGFDFTIQYRPGPENKAADALSRKAETPELAAVTGPVAIQLEEISGEVDKDEGLQKLIAELQKDPASHPDYSLVQGRLLRHGRLVVPKKSTLIGMIMQELHDSKT